jgi:HEPN domain-containing protein
MKPPEPWKILLEKASQDEQAVDRLSGFSDSSQEIIGFHLQQAAEKMLKSALGSLGIAYRFTHNLGEMIHLLKIGGHPLPPELDRLRDLTPYATEWRYDFVPNEGNDDVDLKTLRESVRQLRVWVEKIIQQKEEPVEETTDLTE